MMMGAASPNVVHGCSKEAGEGNTPKRPRGGPMKIGHFHDEVSPTYFAIVIIAPGLDFLPITGGIRPYLGTISRTVTLKTNTGCSWMMMLKDVNGMVSMDRGWSGFVVGHSIKIVYFWTFKVIKSRSAPLTLSMIDE
jgi:hypothetical protein